MRPMLASPSTGASNRVPISIDSLAGTHAFDVKLDGIRAFAHWDGEQLRLVNRNGVDITRKYPDLTGPAEQHIAGRRTSLLLDGEIVAVDGRFETVLTRDKQENSHAIARAATQHPVAFYAFDLPTTERQTWTERRTRLEALGVDQIPGFHLTTVSHDPAFLQQVCALGLEGVIAKRTTSLYESGARSRSWVKFKNLHRVTCLVAGYEPGQGSRSHFGAMLLAMVDPAGQIVSAGRVGTGMTAAQTHELKARIDAREVLVVEIECLGVTSGAVLRMPVFKGVRTDVDVLAATTAQLATLPRS